MPLLAIALLALVVGLLIGTVGVGGVALPPFLVWFGGLDPHTAAGTASWSFLFTGIVGTAAYARGSAVPWRLVGLLSVGIVPAALLGALVNRVLPDRVALLPLAVLVAAAGVHSLSTGRQRSAEPGRRLPGPALAVPIGAVVGFCSALTGTGGPVILMPILLALGVPALTAVAASQAVQVPLVVFAVLGYAPHGAVDFGLGTLIGVIAAAGAAVGAAIAMRLPRRILHRIAGIALVGFGAALLASIVLAPAIGAAAR